MIRKARNIAFSAVRMALFAGLSVLALTKTAETQNSSLSALAPVTLAEIQRLANLGSAYAQTMLGQMYEFGSRKGAVQNYVEAEKWYRRAAEQGDPYAQSSLGFMYVQGRVVPRDFVQAHKWLNLAATRFEEPEKEADRLFTESQTEEHEGFVRSKKEVQETTVKMREALARRMTAAQVIKAQKLASAWKPSSELMKSIQPADLKRWTEIIRNVARKKCAEGDHAACEEAKQKH
jgi:hypothetical protein